MSDEIKSDYAVEVGFIQVVWSAVERGLTTREVGETSIGVSPVGYVFD